MDQKTCTRCHTSKPLEEFGWKAPVKRTGIRYRRTHCKRCHGHLLGLLKENPERVRAKTQARNKRRSHERQHNVNQHKWIWEDSRHDDRDAGRENDLTKEFIKVEIEKGCSYCGETELRMTLDRIDNDRGHTMDNVVPACIRCNYTRKDMPHEAWLVVATGMREARQQGLFGDWTGRAR